MLQFIVLMLYARSVELKRRRRVAGSRKTRVLSDGSVHSKDKFRFCDEDAPLYTVFGIKRVAQGVTDYVNTNHRKG